MIAWAIDKFWFTVICPQCSSLFALEFELTSKDLLKIVTDRVSAIFLLAVPLIGWALIVLPYKTLRDPVAWRTAFARWSKPIAWFIAVAGWIWLLESGYKMAAMYLPEFLRAYAESYYLRISGTVLGIREITFTGKLGAFIGLLIGSYLFMANGLAGEKKA